MSKLQKKPSAKGETVSPQKRTTSTSKLKISSIFSTFMGHSCPPGFVSSRLKSVRIHADPDKKLQFTYP
jgi:hypothetical protein